MTDKQPTLSRSIRKEAVLFVALFLFGLIVLPVCVWFTGKLVFGAYGGSGYGEFFAALATRIRSLDPAAWFLVLSPWIVIQILRLMLLGWRTVGKM